MSIDVQSLSKKYGSQKALDDISFRADPGIITGFLGPNGAGKSTTMKIAMGYIKPLSGDVLVNGVSVVSQNKASRKLMGYLPEHNPLYFEMYVREFLEFIGRSYGLNGRRLAQQLENVVISCGLELEAHKKIGQLSKGYKQRVGLAKALLSDPEILILDEPTTGLDPNQLVEIRQLIKSVSQNKTVLLSTHIMQEVEALCEHVVIINKGKIVADSRLDTLKSSFESSYTYFVEFDHEIDPSAFVFPFPVQVSKDVSLNTVSFSSENEKLRQFILDQVSEKKLPLASIKKKQGSLEHIFHSLTSSHVDNLS